MDTVTVVFTNGNIVTFEAQAFDVDLTRDFNDLNKYPYKDARGEDSTIHLKPREVAGVFLTKPSSVREPAIRYSVAGRQ